MADLRRTLLKHFPDLMPVVYNPSLEQALFWSNSPQLDALLKPAGDNTAARILKLKTAEDQINAAYAEVLGRAPDSGERAQLKTLLESGPAEAGVKNLLWTLVASAEFQLNH